VGSTQIVPLDDRNAEKCPRVRKTWSRVNVFSAKSEKWCAHTENPLKFSKISKNRDHHDHQRDHHFSTKMYGVTIMMVI
jgi:hypothetical protein